MSRREYEDALDDALYSGSRFSKLVNAAGSRLPTIIAQISKTGSMNQLRFIADKFGVDVDDLVGLKQVMRKLNVKYGASLSRHPRRGRRSYVFGSPYAQGEAHGYIGELGMIVHRVEDASKRYMDQAQASVFKKAAQQIKAAMNTLARMPS